MFSSVIQLDISSPLIYSTKKIIHENELHESGLEENLSIKKSKKIALISIFFGIGLFWWLRKTSRAVPGEKLVREFLLGKVGADRSRTLLTQFRNNYQDLYQRREIPQNRILRLHLNQAILPVVTFYQVLLPINNGKKEITIKEIESLVHEWTLNITRYFISPLRFFRHPFRLFKPGFDIVMKLFPLSGFDIEYLEKSDERIAFNIRGCFYLNSLIRYGVPELTTVFCAADEAMAELFPASIRFQRTKTLGRGGNLCDFRYCRVNQKID